MPTYEYNCRGCGHGFEIQQAMSEDPLTTCPECSGELKKVFHPVGIAFKGSGFYKNDARSGTSTPAGSGSTSSEGATSESGSGGGSSSGDSGGSTDKSSPSQGSGGSDTSTPSKKPAVAAASD